MSSSAENARRPPEVPSQHRHEEVRPRESPQHEAPTQHRLTLGRIGVRPFMPPRIATLVYLATVAVLCLLVPWRVSYRRYGSFPWGYAPLWDPPRLDLDAEVLLDVPRLVVSLIAATVIFAFLSLLSSLWKRRGRTGGQAPVV